MRGVPGAVAALLLPQPLCASAVAACSAAASPAAAVVFAARRWCCCSAALLSLLAVRGYCRSAASLLDRCRSSLHYCCSSWCCAACPATAAVLRPSRPPRILQLPGLCCIGCCVWTADPWTSRRSAGRRGGRRVTGGARRAVRLVVSLRRRRVCCAHLNCLWLRVDPREGTVLLLWCTC